MLLAQYILRFRFAAKCVHYGNSCFKGMYMKKIIVLLVLSLFPALAMAEETGIAFDNVNYKLAFVQNTEPVDINEYLPQGQMLGNWKKMIALHRYNDTEQSPEEFAKEFADILKITNPDATSSIIKNEKSGEALIEFFIWTDKEPLIGEFNIFRFRKDEKTGKLVALQYAFRNYGQVTKAFEDELTKNKARWIQMITQQPFPEYIAEKKA